MSILKIIAILFSFVNKNDAKRFVFSVYIFDKKTGKIFLFEHLYLKLEIIFAFSVFSSDFFENELFDFICLYIVYLLVF